MRLHNRELKTSFKGVDGATMKMLMSLPWKGNVRELDNVIEHAMILGDGDWITAADLPRALQADVDHSDGRRATTCATRCAPTRRRTSSRCCRRPIKTRSGAPRRLGVSLSSLYRKIEELEIGGLSRDASN